MTALLARLVAWVRSEPAALGGAFTAIVGVLMAFGLQLSPNLVGGITSAIALIVGLVVRSQVTPTVATPAPAPAPAPPAPPAA